MATETLTRPDERTETKPDDGNGTGDKEPAHYVRKDQIVASAVEGSHVVALCGEVFPVTRDTKGRPICQACKAVYERMHSSD